MPEENKPAEPKAPSPEQLAAENTELKAKLAQIEKDTATVAALVREGLTEAQARQKLTFQKRLDEQLVEEEARATEAAEKAAKKGRR